MAWFLVGISALVTALSYIAIQHSDNKKKANGKIETAGGSNLPALVVIFLVTLIASYWMYGLMDGNGTQRSGGTLSDSAYEAKLVSQIPHDCINGAPPF